MTPQDNCTWVIENERRIGWTQPCHYRAGELAWQAAVYINRPSGLGRPAGIYKTEAEAEAAVRREAGATN